jgi:hypothetical protein
MRRVMLLVVSVLMIVTMALSPALAHDRGDGDNDHDGWSEEFGFWVVVPVLVFVDGDFDGIEDSDDCGWVSCSAISWGGGDWGDCEWDDGEWDDCPWDD